ncbi:alpha/beta hydrolase [Kineothrix sedimenti]|uniref:Alpha/beta hydrolase n=1 Tax=Kineothrix sedimenti TaxID=3123317 RepID=A0ABZ3EY91_9FIRM
MYRLNSKGIYYRDIVEGVEEQLVEMGFGALGMYYTAKKKNELSNIAVLLMHCDQNYMSQNMGPQLASQGFQVLACDSEFGEIENKFRTLNKAMNFLKSLPDVKKVILMGHSGGATLMTAYQSIAEKGAQIYRGNEKIYATTIQEELIPADGIMLIDANYGNGVMTLLSLDPAVIEEGNGMRLDPELDIFNPANGYDPAGAHYTKAFIEKYFKAQADRNRRLIKLALNRLELINSGRGNYADDEPFIITAGNQPKPNNRLIPEDLHFLSHTKKPYDLLRGDGTVTNEIIHCVRTPEIDFCFSRFYNMGANATTVKGFLSSQAINATDEFLVKEDDIVGVDWNSCYASPISNIKHIDVPLLTIGLTGSYEYLAAEMIFENAQMGDKTIAFIHGAGHMFTPNHSAEKKHGSFGNTEKVLYDYMGTWMRRFM